MQLVWDKVCIESNSLRAGGGEMALTDLREVREAVEVSAAGGKEGDSIMPSMLVGGPVW